MFRVSLVITILAASGIPDASAQGHIPSGRIFYAGWDGTFDASEARGSKQARVLGKVAFAAGRSGQGLVVGDVDGSAAVEYASAGNFQLERGTVAMWVKPVNWNGDAPQYRSFFAGKLGAKGQFLLYRNRNNSWGLTFFLNPDDGPRSKVYCYRPITDWRAGEWHHIACAWTRHEAMVIYIDGREVKRLAGSAMTDKDPGPAIQFGGSWQRTGQRTVIDEAMIFGRMLASHEIAALAGEGLAAPAADTPRDIPGVMLAHAILGQKVLARVYRDALDDTLVEEARLTLRPAKSGKAIAVTAKLDQPLTLLHVSTAREPKGMYAAKLELLRDGKAQAAEQITISKETDHTWESASRLGKEDTVLPPFEPLKVSGDRVLCYGREYRFAATGLLAGVSSQGAGMLAGQVRIVADDASFAATRLRVHDASPVQAKLSGGLRAAQLDVDASTLVRYTGTAWTRLTFKPKSGLEVRRLRVEVPVAAGQAKYLAYIGLGRIDAKRLGYDALPQGDGVVWHREFMSSVWLGTESRGLGWYAESDEHWDIQDDAALTVERRGDSAVLCMNIIRKPRRLAGPFSIEFGLQATPVRPLAADWRSYQYVPSVDITKFFLHLRKTPYPRPYLAGLRPRGKVCYLYNYHPYFTNTLPKDPDEFREMVDRAKGHGLLCVPYTDTTFICENSGDLWEKSDAILPQPVARGASYGPVCPVSGCHTGPFGDRFVWYVSHLAEAYGSNGIYMDDTWPYGCANAAHGCGYVGPDGTRRVTYPLRARNETYRRIRAVLAATGKPFHITLHMSGGRCSPLPTFGDSLLLGEDRYHHVRANPDYTENMTAAQWRAGYSTPAWGIPVVMLPQFKMSGEWMKSEDLALKFMAAVVPHDLIVWTLFVNSEAVIEIRAALIAFGIRQPDTRFVPYWESGTGVSTSDRRVKLSAYVRPGKALLCASNWSADPIDALTVDLQPDALGLMLPLRARDALSQADVPMDGAQLTFPMPPKRLRLVEITSSRHKR